MKNQKWILFSVMLAAIAGSAALLAGMKKHPQLGKPGIRAEPIPGSVAMKIDLPAGVSNFISTNVPEPAVVLGYLPHDSSYVERHYESPDSPIPIEGIIVLMGTDRTSIHNADYCLVGQGLDPFAKSIVNIPIGGSTPYALPVSEWKVSGTFQRPNGESVKENGVYVFWFVADGDQTPDHLKMMEKLAGHLLKTGEMERWAYVNYFSACEPGQEDATFERIKKLIAASVPEFQLPPSKKI
ncbi:MAG TPA: hypothetical protein VGN23_00880 [Verrucomicrobiae bacterium]